MKKALTLFISLLSTYSMAATDPKVAYTMVQEGKAVMVDVREKNEIEDGMIKDALWFPLSKTEGSEKWPQEFKDLVGNKPIFLYCRSGRRSGAFKDMLTKHEIKSENIGGFESLKKVLPVSP